MKEPKALEMYDGIRDVIEVADVAKLKALILELPDGVMLEICVSNSEKGVIRDES